MNSFVSVYYYLRVVKTSFFDRTETAFPPVSLSPAMMVVLVITAIGTLGLGFFPGQLLEWTQSAIFAFL